MCDNSRDFFPKADKSYKSHYGKPQNKTVSKKQ